MNRNDKIKKLHEFKFVTLFIFIIHQSEAISLAFTHHSPPANIHAYLTGATFSANRFVLEIAQQALTETYCFFLSQWIFSLSSLDVCSPVELGSYYERLQNRSKQGKKRKKKVHSLGMVILFEINRNVVSNKLSRHNSKFRV